MAIYSVSYDLIKRKDYPELWKQLNGFQSKVHLLGSTWIIETNLDSQGLCSQLTRHIDSDDKLIVSELVKPRGSTWTVSFPEAVRTWLRSKLD